MNEEQLVRDVICLVRQIGHYQIQNFTINPKKGRLKEGKEVVSDIDIVSEKKTYTWIGESLTSSRVFGEETGRSGSKNFFWIIDPIDGTTNYLSGLNHFSISIALMKNDQLVLGVVYKPISDEIWYAIKGKGAFYNEKKLNLSHKYKLSDSLIGSGFPYRSKDLRQQFFQACDDILDASRGIRRYGSATLDLAYVASGIFQGFWESDLEPYDVAAGLLILSEAGGRYESLNNKPYDLFSDRILIAGCESVMSSLSKIINQNYL